MLWDDIRVVRAIYQTGSFAGAARQLGVNETTVPRRLARLEKDLGVTLFEAVDGQRRATHVCEEIVALSENMALNVERIAGIVNSDTPPVETRRITATDSISTYLLAPNLPDFLVENPTIALELDASTSNVDFSRWEADLAIRLRRPGKGDFIVSKLLDFDLFFVEPLVLQSDERLLIAYPAELDFSPESKFLKKLGLQNRARCRTMNLVFNKQMITSGKVAGILPGFMCEEFLSDDRFQLTQLPQSRSAWLLMQRHLRNDKVTRRIVEWIRSCVQEEP